jgi:hypothetical protein
MSEVIDLTKCLKLIRPNSLFTLNGDTYEGLVWQSDDEKPTKKELIDAWPLAKAAFEKEIADAIAKKQAVYDKLGLSADEVEALIS